MLVALNVNQGLPERGGDRYGRFLCISCQEVEMHCKKMVRVDSQVYKHSLSVRGERVE